MGYVSRRACPGGHAAVLEQEWAKDKKRRKKCGVPAAIRFRTRHALALEMLAEHGKALPHGWIAGDDEMGRSSAFRRDLRSLGERYLLAVPSNTLVRDLDAPSPEYCGRGRRPQIPYVRVDRWCAALPENAWMTIEVRDGGSRPAGGAGREDTRPGEERSTSQRSRRAVGGGARGAERWYDEARLPPRERGAKRRWPNSPVSSRPSIGSRSASSVRKAKRGLPNIRSAIGVGGTTIKHSRCWPHGS